jgi:ABC-type glutathione transport system ATPase component
MAKTLFKNAFVVSCNDKIGDAAQRCAPCGKAADPARHDAGGVGMAEGLPFRAALRRRRAGMPRRAGAFRQRRPLYSGTARERSPMSMAPLLKVRDLVVSYRLGSAFGASRRVVEAVRNVSFDIHAGQGFALVGESGSGKTTISRAILGLVPTSDGTIEFDGRDVSRHDKASLAAFRRDVQVVFQDPRSSLNPRRAIRAAIGSVLERHFALTRAETENRVAELMDNVGLASYYMHRFPGELSGGQRQRVAIARALATRPRLLVCDEPVSALDVSTQSQILNLLGDLRNQFGLAYLFISHDLAVVRQVAEVVAVLHRGAIVEAGPTEQIYRAPQQAYTRVLLSSVLDHDPRRREQRRAARAALRAASAASANVQ